MQSGKDLVQEVAKLRRSLDDAEGLSRDTKKEWAFLRSENIALEERVVSGINTKYTQMIIWVLANISYVKSITAIDFTVVYNMDVRFFVLYFWHQDQYLCGVSCHGLLCRSLYLSTMISWTMR